MQKYVFTIKEDVCASNNRSEKVPELLAILPNYGELVPFDAAVAQIKAEYQDTIDNLTYQLDKLKAHNLTDEEIKILNVIRAAEIESNQKREQQFTEEKNRLETEIAAAKAKVTAVTNEVANMRRRVLQVVGGTEEA